jgi:hypothetical protein
VDDGEGTSEIERLVKEFAGATARRRALLEELQEFAARIHEIRAAFGNPFFYTRPENADESVSNYTGSSSHEVVLPTALALRRVDQDIRRLKTGLRGLGASVDEPWNRGDQLKGRPTLRWSRRAHVLCDHVVAARGAWKNISAQSLNREVHPQQELPKPWIRTQRLQRRIRLDVEQARAALPIRLFEPREGGVVLS